MNVLGCVVDGNVLRGVVIEGPSGRSAVTAFVEQPIVNFDVVPALRAMIEDTGVRNVAWTLDPADAQVARLSAEGAIRPSKRKGAARLKAVAMHFKEDDIVHVVEGASGVPYFAVARRDVVSALSARITAAGGRLVFADSTAYAWSAVVPRDMESLIIARDGDVEVVVVGRERVSSGTFALTGSADASRVAREIADAFTSAARTGFVDVARVGVIDRDGVLLDVLREQTDLGTIVPFELALDPDRTAWALACGVASRAAGINPSGRLLINVAPAVGNNAVVGRLASRLDPSDVGVVGLAVAAALGLFVWREHALHDAIVHQSRLSIVLTQSRDRAAEIDRLVSGIASARGIMLTVDATRRSGPIAARELAAIGSGMHGSVSATTLDEDATGWTLVGHAASYGDVAVLMSDLAASGYAPSITVASDGGSRVAYTLTLGRAAHS